MDMGEVSGRFEADGKCRRGRKPKALLEWAVALLVSVSALVGCQDSDRRLGNSSAKMKQLPESVGQTSDEPSQSSPVDVQASGPVQPDGHQRMIKELRELAGKEENKRSGWNVQRAVAQGRSPSKSKTNGNDPKAEWHDFYAKAQIAAEDGDERQAIEYLKQAYSLADSIKARDLRFQASFRLGVAYMRLAETENCCASNTPDSCILPIRGGGLHKNKEGSTRALDYLTQVLRESQRGSPIRFKAQWLLNVAYMTLGEYPGGVPEEYLIDPKQFESEQPFPAFRNVAKDKGLDSFDLCGGAIVEDFDNDLDLDVVSSSWDVEGQLLFFRNDGDGNFSNQTVSAGLAGIYGGLNINQADYNNDGFMDILVLRGGWWRKKGSMPNSLLKNNGDGTFTDVTYEAGLGEKWYPTQTATWADFDNDGDLDLYIGNESGFGYNVPSCQLFRNNGDGTFTDIAREAGVLNDRFTKGVSAGDYNNDRWPDIYVSNLDQPNRLYRNNGDGTFTDVAVSANVSHPIASFPCWFWDYDNDGQLDIYVASFLWARFQHCLGIVSASYLGELDRLPLGNAAETARLYRGDGKGGFEDVTRASNIHRPDLVMGANFGDVDNDGWLDFYLGTGYPDYEALMPNVMYRNRGAEGGFADVTTAAGLGHLQKGHGIAMADLDEDGDVDIFAQLGGAYRGDRYYNALFENPGNENGSITLKLVGVTSNRAAVGARIRVDIEENGQSRSVYRHVNSGGSFGASPMRQTIGVGTASKVSRVEVYWPTSDTTQTFEDLEVGRFYRVTEGDDDIEALR